MVIVAEGIFVQFVAFFPGVVYERESLLVKSSHHRSPSRSHREIRISRVLNLLMGLDSITVLLKEGVDFLITLGRDDLLRFKLGQELLGSSRLKLSLALVNPLTETVHGNLLTVKRLHRFN